MADDLELTKLWLKFREETSLTIEEKAEIDQILAGLDQSILPNDLIQEPESEVKPEYVVKKKEGVDVRKLVDSLSIPKRVKLAMSGNKSARAVLVDDANRMVQLAVLKNPKIGVGEIQDFASNNQIDEYILRAIAMSSEWTRDYNVKKALVKNPKTPLDISLKWIRFLNMGDIKQLAKSKNIPQVLAVAAKKVVQDAQKG